MTITANSSLDEVLRYFDCYHNPNAWPCPETERIIDAETCLECYLDALENLDPDDTCLSCKSAQRAYQWEHRRRKTKKPTDAEWLKWIQEPADFEINDTIDHPSHYCSHPSGIECIEITRHHDFCTGNAIKYLWRCGLKGGKEKRVEDLKKALKYIEFAVDKELRGYC